MQRASSPSATASTTRQTGYSLVEVMVCVVIVGGMFAAAVHTLGAARLGEQQTTERTRGHMLAHALMDEILRQAYEDPGDNAVFGPEPGEDDGTRLAFDDVDDYHEWSASPPTEADGTALEDFEGWTRRVVVAWVDPADPEQTRTYETGLKRITVTVERGRAKLAEVVALRSRALQKERAPGAAVP